MVVKGRGRVGGKCGWYTCEEVLCVCVCVCVCVERGGG